MCTKKSCCIGLAVVILLLALLINTILTKGDYFKEIRLFNQEKCKTIDIPLPVEDLEIFMEKYLIGGMNDNIQLFLLGGIETAKNGGLIAWRLDAIDNSQHLVRVEKFPKQVRFQAHGIYLEKESHTLFVLNHASKYGGERVEVFRLSQENNQVVATYMRSVKLTDPSVQGVLNDLTVIGDFIYLTQASPTPNAMGKPDHSLFKELKETYMTLFTKFGIIRKCKNTRADNQVEEEAECEEEVKEEIGVGNGITTNGFTKLWAVDNQARDIVEFDVEELEIKSKN